MSGVSYYIECPRCRQNFAHLTNYKDGSVDVICFKCGFYSEDGETQKTYGAYAIFYTNQSGRSGPVGEPITKNMIDQFIETIQKNNVKYYRCYLTEWDKEKSKVIFHVGNKKLVPCSN